MTKRDNFSKILEEVVCMNKKILFSIPLIACLLTSCKGNTYYEEEKYEVGVQWVDPSKDFKILQLCDIHLNQSDDYERHFKMINKTITDANPDLIVINGDTFTYADKALVKKVFAFIDWHRIPWTFTFGNHDDQGYYSDTYIQELLGTKNSYQYVKFVNLPDDDVTGRSNFVINIYERVGGGLDSYHNVDKFQVYCLESHNYNFDTMKYDYIKNDQIDWYERMVQHYATKNGAVMPSAMYFHIPLPEFFEAWHELNGEVENKHNSHRPENFDANASTDEFGGGPAPESDTHLFDKVKELGSTIAISVAHDHINDSVIIYDDVALCFGVHATDRIYYDAKKLGGQVITIDHTNPWNLSFKNIKNSYEDLKEVK